MIITCVLLVLPQVCGVPLLVVVVSRPDVAVLNGLTGRCTCPCGFATNPKDVSTTRSVSEVAGEHKMSKEARGSELGALNDVITNGVFHETIQTGVLIENT